MYIITEYYYNTRQMQGIVGASLSKHHVYVYMHACVGVGSEEGN